MNLTGWEQLLFVCAATAVLAPLLGRYLAATFRDTTARGPSSMLPPIDTASPRTSPNTRKGPPMATAFPRTTSPSPTVMPPPPNTTRSAPLVREANG